jgi:hypothetical protein
MVKHDGAELLSTFLVRWRPRVTSAWIDVNVLASAVVGGFQVWTADRRFLASANQLGVAYFPS